MNSFHSSLSKYIAAVMSSIEPLGHITGKSDILPGECSVFVYEYVFCYQSLCRKWGAFDAQMFYIPYI